jgi:hypothetical protein
MAKRISSSSRRQATPAEMAALVARGYTGPGSESFRNSDSRSSSSTEDRESTESEVDRAKRLGQVAASMSEESKDRDFGRQKEADTTRFTRDRQAAGEDDAMARGRMGLERDLDRDRLNQTDGQERGRMSLGSDLRSRESREADEQERGRMNLGSSLEQKRRDNALSVAMSALQRFR